jgi:hypothetical protein
MKPAHEHIWTRRDGEQILVLQDHRKCLGLSRNADAKILNKAIIAGLAHEAGPRPAMQS